MSGCEQIAGLLWSGTEVALWGASNDAILIINELRSQYNAAPGLVIDSDSKKQGKFFMGIPILSFEDALKKAPDAHIYIVGSNYKYQIIGTLTHDCKFPAGRIINYEPAVWRKGCMFIENALQCVGNSMCFCSSDFGKKRSPRVAFNGTYGETVSHWIELRDEISSCLAQGKSCSCEGCCCVKEDWYAAEKKIHIVNYSEGGICNFECIYCNAAAKHSKGVSESEINLAETLFALEEKGMLADDLHIDYSPGEPALHPKRDSYYAAFSGKYTTLIMTNASVYDDALNGCLSAGKASLCVSVDAGTPATFAKVKGRDVFPMVCENLKKYAGATDGIVGLKYIFLPDVNDTAEDMEGFAQLCKELRPAIVLISYDIFHPVQTMTKRTFRMVTALLERLDEEGIVWKNVSDVIARAFEGELL